MSVKRILVIVLLAGVAAISPLGAQPTGSQQAAPQDQAPPSQLAAADDEHDSYGFVSDRMHRMTVPVRIGGSGPFGFFVDTGAERTVISRELASRLQLAPGKTATVHSMGGVGEVATVVIPKLDVSKRSVSGIHAPALSQVNLGGAGLLGVDSLQSQTVLFDFKNKTLTVSKARRKAHEASDPDTIVVTARSRFGRLILADARLDGEKVWVIVDTGSQVTIGNAALRARLEQRKRLRAPILPIEIVSVMGDRLVGDYTVVGELDVGGVRLKDMPMAFAEVHPFKKLGLDDRPAMLLGMDTLQVFDQVSVDFLNRKVRFTLPDAQNMREDVRLASL